MSFKLGYRLSCLDGGNYVRFHAQKVGMDEKAGMGKGCRETGKREWEKRFFPVTRQIGNGKRSFFPTGMFRFFPSRKIVKKY